jgi:hypothetical protein
MPMNDMPYPAVTSQPPEMYDKSGHSRRQVSVGFHARQDGSQLVDLRPVEVAPVSVPVRTSWVDTVFALVIFVASIVAFCVGVAAI